jgi:hypothetical protein
LIQNGTNDCPVTQADPQVIVSLFVNVKAHLYTSIRTRTDAPAQRSVQKTIGVRKAVTTCAGIGTDASSLKQGIVSV